MDNSQSSDFLSESTDMFCVSPSNPGIMDVDTVSYTSLVSNTKKALSSICQNIQKSTFPSYLSSLLDDCSTCISQSLDLVTEIVALVDINHKELIEYMNDAVCLLQLLSDLIKNVIETISLSCCSMKNFPTATGRIILLVFIHCKDSATLYGSQLNYVEKQLKDLFRTCHELQLTYLMVLEKQFIFDLTEREEQDILIEALDINLKIGEIVQSLDVKTMAEQWKAYTMICEKYSNNLMDKKIYSDSTKILCSMVTNNIKTALEEIQDEKSILRCLKVSSFTLKILLRVCNTFRHSVVKDYESIVELLIFIHLNSESYLETICGKSSQFINLFNNNVSSPVNTLLKELLLDEYLVLFICNYGINKIIKDDKLLGVILLVLSVIRIVIQNSDQTIKAPKRNIVDVIYSFLPLCHTWFNMGLKFKCESQSTRQNLTYGLYEHLLAHTLALAATLNTEEVNVLEKKMMEAILSTDCYSAMFSSNLWVLLSRLSSRQLLLEQFISLCKMYHALENNYMFAHSPQNVHLSHTISRLFESLHVEDKNQIYQIFPIHEEKNISLWGCIKLCNLNNETQIAAEEICLEKFKMHMSHLSTENSVDIVAVINIINLASTCSIVNREDEMKRLLIKAWMMACRKNIENVVRELNKGTVWFYKYIEALVCLTNSMEHVFHDSVTLVKVLHVVSNIVQSGCKELKLSLITILCKLANFETHDMNKHVVDSILTQTFRELFQDTDLTVKNKLFSMLRKYKNNSLDRIVSKIVNENEMLKETWTNFKRHGRLKNGDIELKEQLLFTMDFPYCHKCIADVAYRDSGSVIMQKSLSNNFDFVDIDSLFDGGSDTEPASKKAKLNSNEVEQIITRLETDASALCKIKKNIFTSEYIYRIKTVCDKLNNIVE